MAKKKKKNKNAELIRDDLLKQLEEQNMYGKQLEDMIDDYISLYDLKEQLKKDINDNGIRYTNMTGNGFPVEKPNESVVNILKVNNQMLKILQDLGLKTPEAKDGDDDDLLS